MAHSKQINKYCLSFLAFKAENTLTTENIGDMSHLHIYVWTCTCNRVKESTLQTDIFLKISLSHSLSLKRNLKHKKVSTCIY